MDFEPFQYHPCGTRRTPRRVRTRDPLGSIPESIKFQRSKFVRRNSPWESSKWPMWSANVQSDRVMTKKARMASFIGDCPPPNRFAVACRSGCIGRFRRPTSADIRRRNSGSQASTGSIQGAWDKNAAHRCGNPDQPSVAASLAQLALLPDDCSPQSRHRLATSG